jgi:large subunit ribosomal protein L30
MAAKKKLKLTQLRSGAGRPVGQQRTLRGLGLNGPRTEAIVDNTPSFRGAVKKVLHLVDVEEVDG